ncbi:MAG: PAS domain S-box protein [Acidobacteriota bacterium]
MSTAAAGPPPIHWHSRLEVRVVVGLSLLIGLSLGAALIATSRVVTSLSLARASDTLEAARSAFYVLVRRQAEFAIAQTRLITALPVFRAHISDARLARDGPTLDAMVDEYRQQLKAQFCILTDPDGAWTSHPGWPAGDAPPSPGLRSSIDAAVAGRSHHEVLAIGHQLVLIVSEPALFAEEVLGTLTVGYALDDAIARELAQVTHCEVNLIAANHLSGTSLDDAGRAELASLLAGGGLQTQPDFSLDRQSIAGRRYVTGAFPLSPDRPSGGADRLLLLQDWQPTQRFLDELRISFLRTGAVIFLIAVGAGIAFSRRVTRPFQDIAAAADDIAAGNWQRQVPTRGGAESISMAVSFNEMSAHLRHWHQEAQDRSARLAASYERFSSVTESARDAIISTDQHATVVFWSRSAGTIFGYGEDQAIGQSITRFVAESDRQACLTVLTSMGLAGAEVGRTIEVDGIRKDGFRFPIELSVSVWQSGGATHFTAVARDISERKRAEAELQHLNDEIQLQRLRVFRATMRTVQDIVNNLLNGLQLVHLEAEDQLPSEVQTLIDQVIREAATKLKALGNLETVKEKEMVIGQGIDYPGASF